MKMQSRYTGKYALSALIVDDEEYSRLNLAQLLKKHCPQIEIAGYAQDLEEARSCLDRIVPDLVFLDVQMPGGSGFDLIEDQSNPIPYEVIIVTAFPDYGIKAVKAGALDYLLKPLRVRELQLAVLKAWNACLKKRQINSTEGENACKIAVSHHKGISLINKKDIVYLKADNMYTTLYLEKGEALLVSKPIVNFEQLLSEDCFLRIHKSYMINFRFMEGFSKANGGTVWMKNKVEIPVSRRQFPLFQKMLKWYTIPV